MNFHVSQLWHAPVLDRSVIYITSVRLYLSPGCYVPSIWMCSLIPEPGPARWLCYCHLALTGLVPAPCLELLRCHTTCSWRAVLLLWRIEEVPVIPAGFSCQHHPVQLQGWGGTCYCFRELYSCGAALEKSLWPIRITRTRKVSVKTPGICMSCHWINGTVHSHSCSCLWKWKKSLAGKSDSKGPHSALEQVIT